MTLYLTQSEVQTFQRCLREWWLSVYRKLTIKTVLPHGVAVLGTNIHDSLALFYATGADPVKQYDIIYAQLVADIAPEHEFLIEKVNKDWELGRLMLEGYMQWREEEGIDANIIVVGVEQRVDVPFRPEMRLLGKLDLRVQNQFGDRRFLDHKSVGDLTTPLKMLHMDTQLKHYHLLEYLQAIEEGLDPTNGTMCGGGYYNMLRKVKRTARANPPFYGREEITHGVQELRQFYKQVYEISDRILRMRERLDSGLEDPTVIAPPTPRGDCSWRCQWFHVCPLFDDGSDAERYIGDFAVAHNPLERYNDRTDEL